MITQVTPLVFIGNAQLASVPDFLATHGIQNVLKLYESPPAWPMGFELKDSPVPDGELMESGKMEELVQFVLNSVSSEKKTLIVCGAGISRSATLTLAYLVKGEKMDLPQAYHHLRTVHPPADPHPLLWESLLNYLKLDYTWMDILSWRISATQ